MEARVGARRQHLRCKRPERACDAIASRGTPIKTTGAGGEIRVFTLYLILPRYLIS
jgi:hypothetical protein